MREMFEKMMRDRNVRSVVSYAVLLCFSTTAMLSAYSTSIFGSVDTGNSLDTATSINVDTIVGRSASVSGPVSAGESFSYTVTVSNMINIDFTKIRLVDRLPKGLVYEVDSIESNYGDIVDVRVVDSDNGSRLEYVIDFENARDAVASDLIISYKLDVGTVPSGTRSLVSSTDAYFYTAEQDVYAGRYSYHRNSAGHDIEYFENNNYFSIKASAEWINATVLPAEFRVQLYKDAVAYGDVVSLNEDNSWTYTWDITDTDSNMAAVARSTSWTVIKLDNFNNYSTSTELLDGNHFVFKNTYIDDAASGGTGLDNNAGTGNLGGTGSISSGPTGESSYLSSSGGSISSNTSQEFVLSTVKKDKNPDKELRKEDVEISISSTKDGSEVNAEEVGFGEVFNYNITFKNNSDEDFEGIRIRTYIPEYTHYYQHSNTLGDYGFIEGREHITWFIPELAKGESISFNFDVSKDYCIAGDIKEQVYYELTDTKDEPYSNLAVDPQYMYSE